MLSGHVISDLHLFTPWSAAPKYLGRIRSAAGESDFFVLNGDVFDFRWSVLPTTEEGVRAAVAWLRTFACEHPTCHVHYVMGNHDGLELLAEHLDVLAGETENLSWHPAYLRIGGALFVHGDLFLRKRVADPFRRRLAPSIRRKHRALNRCYRLLHAMRVHRWHAPIYGSRRCARKILRALRSAGGADGVTDVYFGHTHASFTDYTSGGITFHNTGSVINGLPWHLLPVQIPDAER